MTICKNCGNEFEGNYCNQCGQSAATHRINFNFLWHDIQHGLFHFDKGVLYSLWQLCIRPGHTINEYMNGKRVGHFKPLSLVVVLATVYGLLKHFFLKETVETSKIVINGSNINTETVHAISEWISNHGAIMALIVIPVYALGSYLAYRKQGYNYGEHLVLNAYASSLRLLVTLLMFPLLLLTQHSAGKETLDTVEMLLQLAVTAWCFLPFFGQLKWYVALKKLIYTYLIFLVEMVVIGAILVTLFIVFFLPGKL